MKTSMTLRPTLMAGTFLCAVLMSTAPSFAKDDTTDLNASELSKITTPGMTSDQNMPMDHKHMHGDVEARVRKLHDQLKITPDQEAQWKSVADVMCSNAGMMSDTMNKRKGMAGNMTAVQDMQSYQTLTEEHAQGLQKLVDAFTPLYNSMSPEQQKNADMIFGHKVATKKGA